MEAAIRLATLYLVLSVFYFAPTDDDPLNLRAWVADEIQSAGQSVRISAYNAQGEPQQEGSSPYVFGSGFIINPNGLALTNAHVVNNRETIVVRTTDDNLYSASIVSLDVTNDIALLKIDSPESFSHWLKLGSSSDVALGAKIFVIGYPLAQIMGAAPKVTEGIVSALSGLSDDPTVFQISAPIQPGNSGGPVITPQLEVVGIATEKLSDSYVMRATGSLPQNVNFGVKIDYARLLLSPSHYRAEIDIDAVSMDLAAAADATLLILAGSEHVELAEKAKVIGRDSVIEAETPIRVAFEYDYYFDVFHNTLTRLRIDFISASNGKVMASGNFSGESPFSAETLARRLAKRLLADMGFIANDP